MNGWSGSFIKLLIEKAARLAVNDGIVQEKHIEKAFNDVALQQKKSWQSYQKQIKDIK